jgi:hypothetical protein
MLFVINIFAMYLQKFMIKIKEAAEGEGTKRQGKTKRGKTEGGGHRVMRETVKEGETDRLGETERDARQRETPRPNTWRSIEQIYCIILI